MLFLQYARGRISNTRRRKKWVFGMLGVKERHRRPILRLVKKRSRNHLIPLLVKHVQPGTLILSDEWRAYRGALTNLGYRHFTVNHVSFQPCWSCKWSSHSALGEGMVNIQIDNLEIEGKPNCQAFERASCSNRMDLLAWKQAYERITWSFIEGHSAPVSLLANNCNSFINLH